MILKRIDELNRVAIPKEFMKQLGAKEGSLVEFRFGYGYLFLKVHNEDIDENEIEIPET